MMVGSNQALGRNKEQIEYYALTQLLPFLISHESRFSLPEIHAIKQAQAEYYLREDKLPLPTWIRKSECPDFIIHLPNSDSIGIEIVEAVEEVRRMAEATGNLPGLYMPPLLDRLELTKKQKRQEANNFIRVAHQTPEERHKENPNKIIGVDLSHAMQAAAKTICFAIKGKIAKAEKYQRLKENWLLIYDSSQSACGAGLGYEFLLPYLLSEAEAQKLQPFSVFDKIIILNRECLIFSSAWSKTKIYPTATL